MSDKVRGALFNALGDITGLSVLDAFAGSGAVGFEAISRGAAHATLIDVDKVAQRTIAENIDRLKLIREVKLINASAKAWLTTADETYDIVILDPPYDDLQFDLLYRLLRLASQPGGLAVVSLPPGAAFSPDDENYELLTQKSYGDAQLVFYRRIG